MFKDAYLAWRRFYLWVGRQDHDEALADFLKGTPDYGFWLKRAREALFLSTAEVADRLGTRRDLVARWETREYDGTIRLRDLKRVAEAMDCELVYAIRPRAREPYSKAVFRKLWPLIENDPIALRVPEHRRAPVFAARARDRMLEAKVRRKLGWSRRIGITRDKFPAEWMLPPKTESRPANGPASSP